MRCPGAAGAGHEDGQVGGHDGHVMMAAGASDKCTQVLGSQSGAGSSALWQTAQGKLGLYQQFYG